MANFERDFKPKGRGSRKQSGRDFNRSDSGHSRSRDSDRYGSREQRASQAEMTTVTCDSCKTKCEVPFKPTSSKPVYCSECFKKNKNSPRSSDSGKGLSEINQKLDKIMKALEID